MSIVVIILFVGLVLEFYIKQLLPIKINLTYAYVNEQNELTKVSQPLADELFIHPLEVKSIQHGGNLNIMIFTRESGFSEVEDGFFSCEKDTLVQVYIVNNESEEIKDILHVQELSKRI